MSSDEPPKPFPSSECHGCAHRRDVKTARSWFLRCVVLETKYPPQPVRACPSFEAASGNPRP
ncbi:MAG: hypothetical protein GQE15_38505 [Archangiaceae bacterium]|nr:hypothetical protein [Archangiaceae bacterium]